LYDLKYCDPDGLNHSLPPDILHAILLGYVTRLINGFVQLKQENSEKLFIFSEAFKDEVERDLLSVGLAFTKQSDIDLPKTCFPSRYLLSPQKGDDNTSGKNAHELQGVLLTLLCFLLLHGQLRHLEAHIGGDQLKKLCENDGNNTVDGRMAKQK